MRTGGNSGFERGFVVFGLDRGLMVLDLSGSALQESASLEGEGGAGEYMLDDTEEECWRAPLV